MVIRRENSENENQDKFMKVLFGGFAGMTATSITHPMDVLKVRMQIADQKIGTLTMVQRIVACEGYKALYNGLTAGLFRQATYTTTRLGVYNWLYDDYKTKYSKNPSPVEKVVLGVYAGLAGAFTGTPSEVVLVRLVADGPKTPCTPTLTKPRYTGTLNALHKITRDEGIFALWRGGFLTMVRSVFVSTAQIGSYTQAREIMQETNFAHGFFLHLYSSVISSVLTAVVSLPADVLKTRYQVRKAGESHERISDIIKKEGILFLWKGFIPYYVRLGFHTIITFVILEELNDFYRSYIEEHRKKTKDLNFKVLNEDEK